MLLSFAAMVTITFLCKKLSVGDSIVLMSGHFRILSPPLKELIKEEILGTIGHFGRKTKFKQLLIEIVNLILSSNRLIL